MNKKPFSELGLSAEVLKAVAQMGFEEAAPIQSAAIPVLMEGKDVVGQSQTGSGKTAAFAIPAIEKVDPTIKQPQVLILCPTRELAVQVAEQTAKLAAFKRGVKELPIYGGQSYERQFRGLDMGANIIIGTPGRVMDHMERGSLKLNEVRMVILDEADRMLDMGFVDDIRKVLSDVPEDRQTVFFSATLPRAIQDLIRTFTRDPVSIKIESQAMTAPAIDQIWYEVDRRTKIEVLCRLIDIDDVKYAIIFCATKMMVDDLVEHLLARGYMADKLHGDMTQIMRERVMNKFRNRGIEFLVATDVAARGLDVKEIEVVFNYDLPNDGEDYVHRIGRTGRAGSGGKAVTFVSGREIYKWQNIMRATKGKATRGRVPSIEEVEQRKAHAFFETLKTTLEEGTYKKQEELVERLLDQGHMPTDIVSAVLHLLQPDKAPGAKLTPEQEIEAGWGYQERKPYGKEHGKKFDKPYDKRGKKDYADRPAKKFGREQPRFDEGDTVPLVINIGRKQGISPGDILGMIMNEVGVPKETIGYIKLHDKESVVNIAAPVADEVARKLSGLRYKKLRITASKPE